MCGSEQNNKTLVINNFGDCDSIKCEIYSIKAKLRQQNNKNFFKSIIYGTLSPRLTWIKLKIRWNLQDFSRSQPPIDYWFNYIYIPSSAGSAIRCWPCLVFMLSHPARVNVTFHLAPSPLIVLVLNKTCNNQLPERNPMPSYSSVVF